MAYIDSDGHSCPETAEELHAELGRIATRERDIHASADRLGHDETEWQLTHCRVMRRQWEKELARLEAT